MIWLFLQRPVEETLRRDNIVQLPVIHIVKLYCRYIFVLFVWLVTKLGIYRKTILYLTANNEIKNKGMVEEVGNVLQALENLTSWGHCQGRSEECFLPGAVTFFAHEVCKYFLTAPGKFLTAPIFAFSWGGRNWPRAARKKWWTR